jgi:hypothetical protein
MTAWASQIDFMKLWTQNTADEERKMQKFLLTGLDRIVQSKSDILSKIKVGPSISNPIVRWMEETAYPSTVTVLWAATSTDGCTLSGNLFGEAATYANMIKVIRVGTILERQSDGVQIQVSAVHASNLTFTAATYGSSASTTYDSAGVSWDIIAEAWSDYKDADMTRALDRTWRKVGTQIHAESFEIPMTRENTRFELVADETEHQIQALLEKMQRQIAYSVIRSKPYYNSGYKFGDEAESPTMLGLSTWPVITQAETANTNVYVNASTAEISKTYLDNLIRNMWLDEHSDFNSGNWYILCHPNVHQFIVDLDISFREMTKDTKDIGFMVDTFGAKIGKKFPILSDRYMRPDVLHVCDLSKASYGYYNNDKLNRKELATQGRYRRWLVSFQTYGVVLRKPRQSIGTIYGLATSM